MGCMNTDDPRPLAVAASMSRATLFMAGRRLRKSVTEEKQLTCSSPWVGRRTFWGCWLTPEMRLGMEEETSWPMLTAASLCPCCTGLSQAAMSRWGAGCP